MKLKLASQKMFVLMCLVLVAFVAGVVGAGLKTLDFMKTKSEKIVDLKLQNAEFEKQQEVYLKARAEIEKFREYGEVAESVLPKEKNPALITAEIIAIAREAGITLSSISYPSSEIGTPTAPPNSLNTQLKPAEGLKDVMVLEISITPDRGVTYEQLLGLLSRFSNNKRKMSVTRVSVNSDRDNLITFIIGLNLYIKP